MSAALWRQLVFRLGCSRPCPAFLTIVTATKYQGSTRRGRNPASGGWLPGQKNHGTGDSSLVAATEQQRVGERTRRNRA